MCRSTKQAEPPSPDSHSLLFSRKNCKAAAFSGELGTLYEGTVWPELNEGSGASTATERVTAARSIAEFMVLFCAHLNNVFVFEYPPQL